MKKLIFGLIIAMATTIGTTHGKDFLSRQEFMSLEKAEKRWGSKAFEPTQFKNGNQKTHASMAVALIKSKKYIGKPISSVRAELGEWDGYFETDGIPAYLIESSDIGSKEAWEILFLPDKTGRNVGEVKIHKNCC